MRHSTVVLLSLAMLAPAPRSHADDSGTWYVGAGAGQSQGRNYCDAQPGVAIHTCDDTGTAWKLFVGYQIDRWFGVEGGYFDLGRFSAGVTPSPSPGSIETKMRTGYLEGVATLPIGDRFGVFAKAGGVYWSLKGRGDLGGPPPGNETNNGVDFIGGAGAQVFITRNLGLRAEYEFIPRLGNSDSGEVDVQVLSASVIWKF